VVDLAVVALLHVAPIYRSADGGRRASWINAAETEELFFATIREGKEAPDLDGFYIRASDLHAAIAKLRSASGSRSPENGRFRHP
jgi:hypothetical protein